MKGEGVLIWKGEGIGRGFRVDEGKAGSLWMEGESAERNRRVGGVGKGMKRGFEMGENWG